MYFIDSSRQMKVIDTGYFPFTLIIIMDSSVHVTLPRAGFIAAGNLKHPLP